MNELFLKGYHLGGVNWDFGFIDHTGTSTSVTTWVEGLEGYLYLCDLISTSVITWVEGYLYW